jgi:hypothetical protein
MYLILHGSGAMLSSQSAILCAGITRAILQLVQDVGQDSGHLALKERDSLLAPDAQREAGIDSN